jgi:hypothetical protein
MEHDSSWADFKDRIHHISERPLPTADDLEFEKDPEAYERREMAKAWKEEQPEFNRLMRLAIDLQIQKVIVSPYSALPQHDGYYVECGLEVDSESASMSERDGGLREWGLSEEQIRSINRSDRSVILISYWAANPCRTLAHEVGHHVECLAGLTEQEKDRPTTKTMRRLFPFDTSLHEDCSEINAECFAEFLTCSDLRRGIAKHCDSILKRLRVQNPKAARLIEMHRQASF